MTVHVSIFSVVSKKKPAVSSWFFDTFLADVVRRSSPSLKLRRAKAEKEGQISKQFKEDLFQIIDFLNECKEK